MGQFSFITQDTNESIRNNVSGRKAKAYMHDDKGNVWAEKAYEGYGEFEGKDFFVLMAEMNCPELITGDDDNDRLIGIDLYFGTRAIINMKTKEIYQANGIDFFNWETDILPHGLSANASLGSGEWQRVTLVRDDIKYPNLTRNKTWKWVNEKPEDCPNQGWADLQ